MGRSKAIVVQEKQQQQRSGDETLAHCTRPSSIRIRRALLLLAGKRGPATPVPSWKLYNAAAETSTTTAGSVSARKLAATLWELQELPLWNGALAKASSKSSSNYGRYHRQQSSNVVVQPQQQQQPPPSPTTPAPHNVAKPSSTKSSDSMRRSPFTDSLHSRRTSEDTYTSETSPEMESSQETVMKPPNSPAVASRAKRTRSRTDEFVKFLSSIRNNGDVGEEQQRNTAVLRLELEQARRRVKQLEQANKLARREIEGLLLELRGRAVAEAELEEERRARAAAESACRRVAAEVEQARAAAAAAVAEAEREKEARRVMEEVCDELAREIGRDKAEVEELRAATRKAREEVEEERRMLQLAEVWREERVQMKLAEARLELEEKNAALDKLKSEMEAFLASKKKSSSPGQVQSSQRLVAFSQPGQNSSGDDEDLHWIDLNKDSLYDRTQGNRWTEKQAGRGGARRGRTRKLRRSKRLIPWPLQRNAGCSSSSSSSSGDEARRAGAVRLWNAGKSVSIEPIPEHRELYTVAGGVDDGSSCTSLSGSEGAFSLARRSFEVTATGKAPILSPMLKFSAAASAAAAASTSTITPHRNSWSAGDGKKQQEIKAAVPHNSLRAMLLMEDPPPSRPRSGKRGK